MSSANLQLRNIKAVNAGAQIGQPIGRILMESGAIGARDLAQVLERSAECGASVEAICLADGIITRDQMLDALARRHAALRVNLHTTPPSPNTAQDLPVSYCLEHGILPWRRIGNATLIATSRPEEFAALKSKLPANVQPVIMAVASEADIQAAILQRHRQALATEAETELPDTESSRGLDRLGRGHRTALAVLAALGLSALVVMPNLFFTAAVAVACVSLLAAMGLKLTAFLAAALPERPVANALPAGHLPRIGLLVPLFHESDIAGVLIKRLTRLNYPRALLDVVLILEEEDSQTRAVLDRIHLPPWIRIVEVPAGSVTTKPRAMNFALKFCKADIIGIYDAEDAPERMQLLEVARRFEQAAPDVACLQGVLDYYNPHANWLSRCFTVEYATWFRVILPGLARLGLAIPLGGTTVFFRRAALEELKGWDAHNVTEDADLGMRLARHGYRTELMNSVTYEEANNRFWPWIRQRSRWLKGYMVTYLVHMRRPRQLLRDFGWRKFLGFQLFFGTAISQFLLAPLLWAFWLVLLGWSHPMQTHLGSAGFLWLAKSFLLAEAVSLIVALYALARTSHRGLAPWVLTMMFYFPMGAVAAYKGLFELLNRPFFWEKTAHGHSLNDTDQPPV